MNIKIRDKVLFLNEKGGGIVVKIINSDLVEVRDEYGFDRPVLIKELIKINSAEKPIFLNDNFISEKNFKNIELDKKIKDVETKQQIFLNNDFEIKIYLAIILNNNIYNFYIVNQSSYNIFINLIKNDNNNLENFYYGQINNNNIIKIKEIEKNKLISNLEIIFQINFFKEKYIELQSPVENQITIKAVKLIKENSFKQTDFFIQNAFLIELFLYNSLQQEVDKISPEELKKIIVTKQKSEKHQKQLGLKYTIKSPVELLEVDLHIHELIDNYKKLSNSEIIDIQRREFYNKMNYAIKNNVKKIIFIHGVGKGVLKSEIRRILEKEYKKYKFKDASYKEYGFGATLVFL